MIPINFRSPCFGVVSFWKSAAPSYHCRNWKSAMDRFAMQHGKAIAMLANDGARIVTKNSDGTLTRQELAADSVFWHDGLSRLPAHI